MAYEAFDPRKAIRTAIGTSHVIDGETEECIPIVTSSGPTKYVPIYVVEEAAIECPPLPYIEINLLSITAIPHNIKASVREHKCLVSFDIKFGDADGMDVTSFGKKVADAIVHQTRTHQCDTAGVYFMNVENQGRLHIEYDCEEIIFHWVMELEATYTDLC